MIVWQDKRKGVLLFAAGALAGATTCCFQPKGMLMLLALLVWLWMQHRRQSASLSWLWTVAGGYTSVVALMLRLFLEPACTLGSVLCQRALAVTAL